MNEWQRIPVFCPCGETRHFAQRVRKFKLLVTYEQLPRVRDLVGTMNQEYVKVKNGDGVSKSDLLCTAVRVVNLDDPLITCELTCIERSTSWSHFFDVFGRLRKLNKESRFPYPPVSFEFDWTFEEVKDQ